MPSHNQRVQQALDRFSGVRPKTVLQEAIRKVRYAFMKRKSLEEFELALGELFVLASDAFRERNGLRNKVEKLEYVIRVQKEVVLNMRAKLGGYNEDIESGLINPEEITMEEVRNSEGIR